MMKKILGIFAIVMIAFAAYNVYYNTESTELNVLLEDVEALADEDLPEVVVTCSSSCYYTGQCYTTNPYWDGITNSNRCVWHGAIWTSCNCS
jgi:hypothetical protein